jgi:3-oxoacyl-[acyl-carrier protein] reductase
MNTVLVTGGSRGIGRAMVELFSKAGYKVAFTYNSSSLAAEEVARTFGALAVKADSRSEAEVVMAVQKAEAELGAIDVLINNAGVSSVGLITDVSLDEWNRVMDTSVTGAFLYSKAVLPQMIRKKWGRIINISSMWGMVGASCEVHYSTAKAALIGFTKALAKEVGPSGITVNAIAPGVIATEMNSAFSDEDMMALADETPVGRIGEACEIARAALFLASEESSFITGEIMNISGGFVV